MNTKYLLDNIHESLILLKNLNPIVSGRRKDDGFQTVPARKYRLQKVLVANRGEIAKRFFLSLHEESIPSVAVVTDADKGQSWYEFADEVVFIGDKDNYSSIPVIIASLFLTSANAVYTGYGFLSENPEFVEALDVVSQSMDYSIIFMGPHYQTMRTVGHKVNARELAGNNSIPLFESSGSLRVDDFDAVRSEARRIGFPVMVKLSAGGGGKGMTVVNGEQGLYDAVCSCSRIGRELYNDGSFYLEEFITRPIHMEVQIFNGSAVGIRKCAVQRRNQKIIEESGHSFLDGDMSSTLITAAERIADISGYSNGGGAGTVEFLIDQETGRIGFIEVNTRLQVEYAVTDQSLGIDLAKWQILFFDGREKEIMGVDVLENRMHQGDHSIECRIYAEEPENNYLPSPGIIQVIDLPTYNGIRCDFGFSEGDRVLPMYDPMIGKIIAHGTTRSEAIIRMERALQELYIKGVKTNVNQLLKIIRHPSFIEGGYTNNLLADNKELNFLVPEKEDHDPDDRRGKKHIIFGAFTEYIHLLQRSVREFMIIANIESIIDSPVLSQVPSRFIIRYNSKDYIVEFIQIGIDTFLTYLNDCYNGKLIMVSVNDRSDDFILIFGNSSYRVRANRYHDHIDIRMRDERNKIKYFRVSVTHGGIEKNESIHDVRSPFQGTFIAFSKKGLKAGLRVTRGEPLVVLSSMKMETTIYAPCTGKIIEVIEDGDLSRLIVSKTSDGRIIGKSLHENELLVKIEIEHDSDSTHQPPDKSEPGQCTYHLSENSVYGLLMSDDLEDIIVSRPQEHLDCLLSLLYAAEQGFIYQNAVIDKIVRNIKKTFNVQQNITVTEKIIQKIILILYQYTRIKRMFSPVHSDEGLSFPQELSRYIQKKSGDEGAFTDDFLRLLHDFFDTYGLARWDGRPEVRAMIMQYVFVLLKRSYQFCLDQMEVIKKLVYVISTIDKPGEEVRLAFRVLYEHEQSERDDSLLKFIKKDIDENVNMQGKFSVAGPGREEKKMTGALAVWREAGIRDDSAVKMKCLDLLNHPEEGLIGDDVPAEFRDVITHKTRILDGAHAVKRLYSPVENMYAYAYTGGERPTYCVLACVAAGNAENFEEVLGRAMSDAASIVHGYHLGREGEQNWVEIIISDLRASWSLHCMSEKTVHYNELKRAGCSLHYFFDSDIVSCGYMSIDVLSADCCGSRNRLIRFSGKEDSIVLDIMHENDGNNPYFHQEKISRLNQKLYDIGKWPVEQWARECFDNGVFEEVTVESIDGDDVATGNPMTSMRSVGAKIFIGTISSDPVCFYMKDSRISGGSTGSREGLKYVAAVYISYLNDWPLFVWNDSAGANIGEGVVSLNRGAEGFMMNALAVQNVDPEKFRRYVKNVEDPELRELFQELNSQFNLFYGKGNKQNRNFLLVAVGIGSSAGLDVYGSSQATIQILLDSDQSYRVLTGSNVIRTVIGEDITNYDIGGAKILGTWTGIVDIVSPDKVHLINTIFTIKHVFRSGGYHHRIRRKGIDKKGDSCIARDVIVLKESIVCENVDHGFFWNFKKNYYASEALIGGFAQLGGRRVLVMGPRTNFGLRSIASIIKAYELMKMAKRTGTAQVLVFGKKWHQSLDYHENISMQSRLDFLKILQVKSGVRINIVTHIDGLKAAEINCCADAVIYMSDRNESVIDYSFVRQNAMFIVSSFEEAFDLAHALINFIDPVRHEKNFEVPDEKPSIPDNPAEPYDIISTVIAPAFDNGSFVEFYREMNNPVTGPHLITGLACLQGRTVGIIADQPLVKGGGADAFGTEKFRIFTELLNGNNIPLVMFSNSSGFVPGSQQERYRIQAIGAESLDANVLGEIPVVSVVLNQNYGGRLIHAFNKFLRPGIVYLAYEKACMAVIGADAAFELLFGKRYNRLCAGGKLDEAENLHNEFMKEYLNRARASNDAFNTGLVDWLIHDMADLRQHLARAMNRAFQRCRDSFGTHWDDL